MSGEVFDDFYKAKYGWPKVKKISKDEIQVRAIRSKFRLSKKEANYWWEQRTYGECEICLKTERLVIDHCHKNGHIRGILCNGCNVRVGLYEKRQLKRPEITRYLAESRLRWKRGSRERLPMTSGCEVAKLNFDESSL